MLALSIRGGSSEKPVSPAFCLSGLSVVRMQLMLALGGKDESLELLFV